MLTRIATTFLMLFTLTVHAAFDLDIEFEPKEPVVNEPFKINFVITSKNGDNPVINFEPSSDLEIISRGNSRVSTRTSFINGKMNYERKITVVYDMVANKAGSEFIKGVEVTLGGETRKKGYIPVRVLKAPRRARSVFVKAQVDKEQYYVGESILVRYYLYNKADISMSATDVKKFPRLDKFLKRYHQEPVNPQRVQINGVPFERRVIYTAQLFAETPGNYKIDPISLNARFSSRRSDPFGNFGFGSLRLGGVKSRTVRSETVKLNILPLPTENRPSSFTGLVGNYTFNLSFNKTKFLANEPIELQFSVQGDGALEVYEAPKILMDPMIEEFETTADLKINQDFSSVKTFDYTYLGRGNVSLPAKKMEISYFDPTTKSYKSNTVDVPAIEVVAVGKSLGGRINPDKPDVARLEEGGSPTSGSRGNEVVGFVMKPIYKAVSSFVYYSKHLFWVIALSLFVGLFVCLYRLLANMQNREIGVIEEIKREGISYKSMYHVFERISQGDNLSELIENSSLSVDAKKYFKDVYQDLKSVFKVDGGGADTKINVKSNYLKEIRKSLEKNANI